MIKYVYSDIGQFVKDLNSQVWNYCEHTNLSGDGIESEVCLMAAIQPILSLAHRDPWLCFHERKENLIPSSFYPEAIMWSIVKVNYTACPPRSWLSNGDLSEVHEGHFSSEMNSVRACRCSPCGPLACWPFWWSDERLSALDDNPAWNTTAMSCMQP